MKTDEKTLLRKAIRPRVLECLGALILAAAVIVLTFRIRNSAGERHAEGKARKKQQIEDILRYLSTQGEQGRTEYALRVAGVLGNYDLTPVQKAQLFALQGDLHLWHAKRGCEKDRAESLFSAREFYGRALAMPLRRPLRTERNLAELMMLEGEWVRAGFLLEKIIRDPGSAGAQRVVLRLALSRCLDKLGRPREALRLLSALLAKAENEVIWTRAALAKADLLVALARPPDEAGKRDSGDRGKPPAETAASELAEARRLYEELSARLSPLHPLASAVRSGLIRTLVLLGDEAAAYAAMTAVFDSQMPAPEKADALMLLAGMHETRHEPAKAVAVLKTGLVKFPESPAVQRILLRLQSLYSRSQQWDAALATARRLALAPLMADPRTAEELLDQLLVEDCPLWQHLDLSSPDNPFRVGIQRLVVEPRQGEADVGKAVRVKLACLHGKLAFDARRYEDAERVLAFGLASGHLLSAQQLEHISYLDLTCAMRLKRPLIVIVFRAWRYLSNFNRGPHTGQALQILFNAYYDLGLYKSAAWVAERAFVRELKEMGLKEEKVLTDDCLRSVARISQCYQKLGFYDKANRAFRIYAHNLLSRMSDPDLFIDWSRSASELGQTREAIRRLDLALPAVKDPAAVLKIQVARGLLSFPTDEPEAAVKARGLVQDLLQDGSLPEVEKQRLARDLYEALLAAAFTSNPADAENLIGEIAAGPGDKDWFFHWIARYLADRIAAGDLGTLTKQAAKEWRRDLALSAGDPDIRDMVMKQLALADSLAAVRDEISALEDREW